MNSRSGHQVTFSSSFFVAAGIAAAALLMGGCSKAPDVAAPGQMGTNAASNVSDVNVTEHVKTALQNNDSLKGFDISVVTLKGDVRLSGMVNNQAQIDTAIQIARGSEGAHTVHDELTIKK